MDQLKENIDSIDISLSKELLKESQKVETTSSAKEEKPKVSSEKKSPSKKASVKKTPAKKAISFNK